MLTPREMAIAFWLAVFVAIACTRAPVRRALAGVILSVLRPKILAIFGMAAAYVLALVWVLWRLDWWVPSLGKDVGIWFCFTGIAALLRHTDTRTADGFVARQCKEGLTIWVIVEYVVATYTFSLGIEMVLVPVVAGIAILGVAAEADPAHTPTKKVLDAVQVLIGAFILTYAIRAAVLDFGELVSLATFRSVFVIPAMSVAFAPFVYVAILFSQYDSIFNRLGWRTNPTRSTKIYAYWRLIRVLGFRLEKVSRFLHRSAFALGEVKCKADINRLLHGNDRRLTMSDPDQLGPSPASHVQFSERT